jgi:hypothetical protein
MLFRWELRSQFCSTYREGLGNSNSALAEKSRGIFRCMFERKMAKEDGSEVGCERRMVRARMRVGGKLIVGVG